MLEMIILSLIFAAILAMSMDHMPLFLKKLFCWIPAEAQALMLHFGYGAWVGGVTGHMLAAMLSVPMYFIIKHYLQPRWGEQCSMAWQNSWFRRKLWTKVEAGWNKFQQVGIALFVPKRRDKASVAA